jgi:lysophospholipid acyltransferase (LPLAT)-like uncharacterized protein
LPTLTSWFVSCLAAAYLRWVDLTSRILWVNRSIRDKLESEGRGFIYAFWHGRQVFLVVTHSGPRSHPLISLSKDGDLIARVCRSFGVVAIRGSSSRGGASALFTMKTALDAGENVGFTPDGPKGPFQQIQPGILYLAQKMGRPIVPVAYGAKKCWTFKGRWDEFIVPKPFNRISMVYGEPVFVTPEDDLVKKALELKTRLDEVTRQADTVACAG